MNSEKLMEITGGAISATWLNSLSRIATLIYDIGYALGSSIRRLFGGKTCKAH